MASQCKTIPTSAGTLGSGWSIACSIASLEEEQVAHLWLAASWVQCDGRLSPVIGEPMGYDPDVCWHCGQWLVYSLQHL